MGKSRVIVTIDRGKNPEIDDLLEQLKEKGLEVENVDTVLDVTQIEGQCDGEPGRFNLDGVVCELAGWKGEIPSEGEQGDSL